MASFTDQSPAYLPSHIPAYDLNLYTQVGMQKESQYQAGIQKIQNTIDNVAGFEVYRDSDKQYLQNKVNDLTSQLNRMAGSDFSNQSVVNQAAGMASSIAKDGRIQKAVLSTQNIKKGFTDIQSAKKDGKWSPDNEWDFMDKVSRYNNGNEDDIFNHSYTPYVDVKKNALEGLRALRPNANISEKSVGLDANGQLVFNPSGDALLKEEFKGISPQQIKEALYATLDAGDYKQLEITGRYSYSNRTPQQLAQAINQTYGQNISDIDAKINTLNTKKQGIQDGAEKTNLENQIAELTREKQDTQYTLNGYLSDINKGNLDGVKAQLYTTRFLNNFANAFSYTETSSDLKENPIAKINLEKQRLAFESDKFKLEYALKAEELNLKKKDNGGLGGVPQTVTAPQVNINDFQSQTSNLEAQAQQTQASFLKSQGHEGDTKWLNEQKELYDSGKQVNPTIANYFKSSAEQEQQILTNKQLITTLNKQADEIYGHPQIDLPKNAKPVRFMYKGDIYDYTPEELSAFAQKLNSLSGKGIKELLAHPISALTGEPSQSQIKFSQELSPKEKVLWDTYNRTNLQGDRYPVSQMDKQISDSIAQYRAKALDGYNKNYQDKQDWINKQLAERTLETQKVAYTIPTGKSEQRAEIVGRVNELINRANDQKQSFGSETIRADYDKINKLVNDEKTSYSLVVKDATSYGPAKYTLRLSKGEKDYQDIPLSVEDKNAIFGNQYENPNGSGFNRINNQLKLTANGSTNFEGTHDPIKASVNPFLKRNDFQNIKNFSVSGDVINQGGGYALALYIYDPIHKRIERREYSPSANLMNEKQVTESIAAMGDEQIYSLLYGKAPSTEDLKNIENLNKKAF